MDDMPWYMAATRARQGQRARPLEAPNDNFNGYPNASGGLGGGRTRFRAVSGQGC
jgi:hypothetical protein